MSEAIFFNSPAYPLEAFPSPMLDAIRCVSGITRAPIPLIAASALGALATAGQGVADVLRPTLPNPGPVSLNLITIADSGERKSAADYFFFAPIKDFDNAQRKKYENDENNFGVNYKIWNEKMAILQQRLRKSARLIIEDSGLENDFRKLLEKEPIRPNKIRIALSDITPVALVDAIARNSCSAVLHSNEAADLMSGRALSNLALFNRLWDGQKIEVDRRDWSRSFQVENARLTTSLAVQPDKFQAFCVANNGHARHSGFLSRTLIAHPTSNAGLRTINNFSDQSVIPEAVSSFQGEITRLMTCAFERHRKGDSRVVLKFSFEASDLWVRFFNDIEGRLHPGIGDLSRSKDFAAKAAEQVARIAALFELLNRLLKYWFAHRQPRTSTA